MAELVTNHPEETDIQDMDGENVFTHHTLPSGWTLWVTTIQRKNKKTTRFNAPIYDISTIEEFWALFNSLLPPSKFTERSNLIFMRCKHLAVLEDDTTDDGTELEQRERIVPEWENESNIGGGELSIDISASDPQYDAIWELTLLGLLGGSIEGYDDINGVWLAHKPNNVHKLSLWNATSYATTPDNVVTITQGWFNILSNNGIDVSNYTATYVSHKDNIANVQKNGNAPKVTYTYKPPASSISKDQ